VTWDEVIVPDQLLYMLNGMPNTNVNQGPKYVVGHLDVSLRNMDSEVWRAMKAQCAMCDCTLAQLIEATYRAYERQPEAARLKAFADAHRIPDAES
jgi:hypothetical protein